MRREKLLTLVPLKAVGAYLSHNCGYDFSRLPGRFSLKALNRGDHCDTSLASGFRA